MTAYKTNPGTVAALVHEEGILVCGAAKCPNGLNVDYRAPAPAAAGWELHDGWWLCPDHREPPEDVLTAIMPKVNGKSFRCECGANVFTHHSATDIIVCNGCGTEYEGAHT